MKSLRFEHSSIIEASAEKLWRFHKAPAALQLLSPKMMGLRIVEPGSGVADGSVLEAEVGFGPFRMCWHALHSGVQEGRSFTDFAIKSPFRYWLHQHVMSPIGPNRSRLTDVIWVVPPRWVPASIARPFLRIGLRGLFVWRHRQTRRAVESNNGPVPTTLSPCSQN